MYEHPPLFDGDERPLTASGDPTVPGVWGQIKEIVSLPVLGSGPHAADVRRGSG